MLRHPSLVHMLLSAASRARTLAGACPVAAASSTLRATQLPYRGVLVEITEDDVPTFEELLPPSLELWAAQGKKSCMLRLAIEHAGLAAVAASHGFEFHHAEGRTAVLKRWLQPNLPDKVPPFATHQVGIAGLVICNGRILLVKEWRDGPDGTRQPSAQWKLPGGLLDRGEAFEQAAVREVFEETGLKTSCRSILSFWHRHGLAWGQSDLYYVARLELVSEGEAANLRACPDEISEITWMPVYEFLETQDHPLIRAVLAKVYGLPGGQLPDGTSPSPLVEMVPSAVQWPNREPYTTYFGSEGADPSAIK